MKNYILSILISCTVGGLKADLLELNDGTILDGTYMGGTTGTLRFQSKGKMEVFPITSVMALTISRTTKQSPGSQVQPSQSTVIVAPQAAPSAPSPSVGPLVVPAGMQFKIKYRYTVSTASSRPGQKFEAVLETNLQAGSVIVAPRGSTVKGTITEVKAPRRIRKAATLAVNLDEIIVGNSTLKLRTKVNKIESGPDGSILRGAALGAIVGEIADNDAGDGAAWGAAAGAMKKGDHIEFKAGSVMGFTLASDLVVKP